MDIAAAVVTVIYYAFLAWISVVLISNFVKCRQWEREVLYVVVLLPFLLRLFRLK